jgi:hypothetical protein
MSKIHIHDEVNVPDPELHDAWNEAFQGFVTRIKGKIAEVQDEDDNVYEIAIDRLKRDDNWSMPHGL